MPASDQPTAMVERYLVARSDLGDPVVYDFTRVLFEERSQLIAENPLASFIAVPNIEGKLALPVHTGAWRYSQREKPGFIQENARLLAPMLYVVVIVSSAFLALRSRVLARRRVRMSHYNHELMDIAEEVGCTVEAGDLVPLHDRLVQMLREVVVDLDNERVSQDEFEHFSFTWSAVDALVRDRLTGRARPLTTNRRCCVRSGGRGLLGRLGSRWGAVLALAVLCLCAGIAIDRLLTSAQVDDASDELFLLMTLRRGALESYFDTVRSELVSGAVASLSAATSPPCGGPGRKSPGIAAPGCSATTSNATPTLSIAAAISRSWPTDPPTLMLIVRSTGWLDPSSQSARKRRSTFSESK